MVEGVNNVTILCRRLVIIKKNETGLQWLIGSPFFSPFTIVSTFKCIHTLPSSPLSPDFPRESGDLRALLLKGFEVIGALTVAAETSTVNAEAICNDAVDAVRKLRKSLIGNNGDDNQDLVGGVVDSNTGDVQFFVSRTGNSNRLESVSSFVYEEEPEKYVWERGCLLKCEIPIKLPVYYQRNNQGDLEDKCTRGIEAVVAKFRNPRATYILEALQECSTEAAEPIIVRGSDLDVQAELMDERLSVGTPQGSNAKTLSCLYFCLKDKAVTSVENADKIQVDILFSASESSLKPVAPVAEYVPGEAKFMVVDYKLEALCYAAKHLPLTHAVSKLVIPALVDQLYTMKNMILPDILSRHPQLHPYHFNPPGFLHPITAIYELSYGETEMKQVEIRKALHLRLGLPFDRPLIRIASAMKFSTMDASRTNVPRKGTPLLKDVHIGIPCSGVTGGIASLVQGSYEYYHYLQGGLDDSGWGCAYRSLQTIVSWFKLQQYTSIDVPSHREIQQSLVEIGDKDPSFTGSREWIGAIELSFVLDKLLGVSCKVINVRSGDELPEKCRELALHFQTQGTPIMIGGGVLAYTLLGVDYSDSTGDCAFLILDPHYTGTDELKKIVNGGWCSWKKAVDSKGKHFFLHNKFYNLLLPQRLNMV